MRLRLALLALPLCACSAPFSETEADPADIASTEAGLQAAQHLDPGLEASIVDAAAYMAPEQDVLGVDVAVHDTVEAAAPDASNMLDAAVPSDSGATEAGLMVTCSSILSPDVAACSGAPGDPYVLYQTADGGINSFLTCSPGTPPVAPCPSGRRCEIGSTNGGAVIGGMCL